jgi:hypothetical protein
MKLSWKRGQPVGIDVRVPATFPSAEPRQELWIALAGPLANVALNNILRRSEATFLFRDVAMVCAGAFLASLLFWRLRQPLILGYVFAGLILSPLTPGPSVHGVHTFEIMAEVGVVLLMFSVGIEFSVPEMLRGRWVAVIGAPLGISLSIGLGIGAGILLGWPLLQGVAVGCNYFGRERHGPHEPAGQSRQA